jgi:hypothetical protein
MIHGLKRVEVLTLKRLGFVQTSQGVVDSGHETCTRSVRALAVDGRVLIAG